MSRREYRGDSPEKKLIRHRFYGNLDPREYRYQKHIVVAGTGGDIEELKTMEVPAMNIIACDKEAKYRSVARNMGATLPPDGISDDIVRTTAWAVKEYGLKSIGSNLVDLCMRLYAGVPLLNGTLSLIPRSSGVLVGFTFLCGHDPKLGKGEDEEIPGKPRKAYFWQHIKRSYSQRNLCSFNPYHSGTSESVGSPMCTVIFR